MDNNAVKEKFISLYGAGEVRLFSAAGRINIIGEHIDYCGGPVLPAALSLRCLIAARLNSTDYINIAATTLDKTARLDINELDAYTNLEFGSYQAGVAYIMQKEGFKLSGCDLLFDCDVPFGSGLSSSAAIEVATAFTLSTFSHEAGGKAGDLVKLAVLSQRAENQYVGVNCGIMDQFASATGKKDNAIYLNCATLEYEYIPVKLKDYAMVIANSNKKRALTDSKYNERRAECETALSLLVKPLKNIKCLADITPADFEKHKSVLSGKILDRAEHVVYECERVKLAAKAMRSGDIELLGKLLNESHYSLRDKYEVTGKELDALTAAARSHSACIGSRMTGAGFGGCTLSLVKKDKVKDFIKTVDDKYFAETGIKADFYDTTIEDGAREIIG